MPLCLCCLVWTAEYDKRRILPPIKQLRLMRFNGNELDGAAPSGYACHTGGGKGLHCHGGPKSERAGDRHHLVRTESTMSASGAK